MAAAPLGVEHLHVLQDIARRRGLDHAQVWAAVHGRTRLRPEDHDRVVDALADEIADRGVSEPSQAINAYGLLVEDLVDALNRGLAD